MENEKEENIVEEQHSVKISINAKLQYSGEVKCYGKYPEDAYDRAHFQAQKLEALIKLKNTGTEK